MSALAAEKTAQLSQVSHPGHIDDVSVSQEVEMLRTLRGVAAVEVAARLEPPVRTSKRMLQLYFICGFMFLGSTMNGYDGALMGSLLALPSFQDQFGATILGIKTGIISSMLQIGSVSALPSVGPCADLFGRRVGIAVGCGFVVMGTILQGTSHHVNQYMAGRFFIGFGSTIANAICPSYVVEFAHPTMRGVITGLYNTCYYLGAILAAAVLRGCVHYASDKAWLIPTWLQMGFPAILLLGCLFFPESPRWQYSHGKFDACKASLIKYHGNDDPDSLWVKLQMREFEEELELDGADKRWWDYRSLFNSRASLYRVLLCAVAISAFSQWTGQAGVSYFLPGMLSTSGITDTTTILDINLGTTLSSGIAAVSGASLMDRFGRRKVLIPCCATLTGIWAIMAACTGVYYQDDNAAAAKASVAFIFLIGMVFSFAYTPLQALYPVETLSYEQRAKGMALQNIAGNAAGLVNMFAIPVALQQITWKTYFVFMATCGLEAVYYWFLMVETKGHTLEEMNAIFRAKNPVQASLVRKDEVEQATTKVKEVVELKEVA
ncbi:hypothetical protein G647_02894 [Cladophialophora carrionii CBS 160.54]|uniref:Major facilitator superfamily (MFS) profile domain-containing protein n=1 Tax=Cladophialophora carrionii CBS 160.54 TaxID=1279043 RepID=V9DJJ6_9EURO|nr:uncharacterized protein G647_02894 [Cladophialophora carrionii CBS 160.54]ETI26117.1 hypothetical protein G647_02894 [Cladophialophora carrionii CBS 160.54]